MHYPFTRRKIFISYHHADQYWKHLLVSEFAIRQSVFEDGSLDDKVDSTQTDYVHRQIREQYVTGTSATIALCGAETWKRKYIDWEIHSTLLKKHGLLGIIVPGTPASSTGYRIPDRFVDNNPAYAILYHWPISGADLRSWIEDAIQRAARVTAINSRPQMAYNQA